MFRNIVQILNMSTFSTNFTQFYTKLTQFIPFSFIISQYCPMGIVEYGTAKPIDISQQNCTNLIK
jgi:hypothetical protein